MSILIQKAFKAITITTFVCILWISLAGLILMRTDLESSLYSVFMFSLSGVCALILGIVFHKQSPAALFILPLCVFNLIPAFVFGSFSWLLLVNEIIAVGIYVFTRFLLVIQRKNSSKNIQKLRRQYEKTHK